MLNFTSFQSIHTNQKMLSSQDLMIDIMSQSLSGIFVGFWIFLTMALVIQWGEEQQQRDEEEEEETLVATTKEEETPSVKETPPVAATAALEADPEDDRYESLYKMLKAEKKKTERMQQVLYQLIGGLYNQETQNKTMMFDVNYLLDTRINEASGECPYETAEDTLLRRKENHNLTTRQGDENAKHIKHIIEYSINQNEVYTRLYDLEKKVDDQEIQIQQLQLQLQGNPHTSMKNPEK